MLLDIFCFVSSLFYHITFWVECKRQHSYFHRIANTIIAGAGLANESRKKEHSPAFEPETCSSNHILLPYEK